MAGQVIADGVVRVSADTTPAERDVAAFQRDFDRRMAAMDRQRATAEVDLRSHKFDREYAKIKTRLADMASEEADPEVTLDTEKFYAEKKKLQAQLKQIDAYKTRVRVDSSELKEAQRAGEELDKQQAAYDKHQEQRYRRERVRTREHSRAVEEDARRTKRRIVEEGRAWSENEKRVRRSLVLEARARRENEAYNRARAKGERETARLMDAAHDDDVRRIRDLDKLRVAYAKALGERQRFERTTGRPLGLTRTANELRQIRAMASETNLLEHAIHKLGGTVADIDPDMERHQGLLSKWATSLAAVRLQMGFFSATLRQLAVGIVTVGPIVTGLAGGLVSLVGVLGTGLAGALAVSGAALGGFAASALGVGLVLKPTIDDFNAAIDASDALAKAELKYGKASDQAKTAQERLNNTLKGISPVARQAISDWGRMKQAWSDQTAGAKRPIFDALGQSIRTMQALLPQFAADTVKTTRVASAAWQKWMVALRSPEGKRSLHELMANFRAAIPGFADGLGSLAAMMGRISVSASKLLPSLSRGFADWAQGLEDSVGSGAKLDSKIERLVDHMRSVGKLAQSAGRFLFNFFDTSADSGQDLVDTLTRVLDRWNAFVQSADGEASLREFFAEAAEETKQFFAVLGRLSTFLFTMGRALAPLTDSILQVMTLVGDLVNAFKPLKSIMQVVGYGFAAKFLLTGLSNAVGVAGALYTNLRKIALLGAGGGILGGIFGGKGKAPSGREFSTVAKTAGAATAASTALSRLGAIGLAAAVGIGAATFGLTKLEGALDNSNDSLSETAPLLEEAKEAWEQAFGKAPAQANKYNEVLDKQVELSRRLKDAREAANKAKPGSQKELAAQRQVAALERQQVQNQVQLGQRRTQILQAARTELSTARERIRAAKDLISASQKERKALEMSGVGPGTDKYDERLRAEAAAQREVAQARRDAARASAVLAASTLNIRRQNEGLKPVAQATLEQLRQLEQFAGRRAAGRVARFVDPQDVDRAAKLANNLRAVGRGAQAKNILVSTKGADQSISKLRQLQKTSAKVDRKTISINARTKGGEQAKQQLTGLSRLSQRVAGAPATLRVLAKTDNARQAVRALQELLRGIENRRYQAQLDLIDRTSPKIPAVQARLRAAAATKHQAKIEAIDKTGTAVRSADNALRSAASKRHAAKITAINQTAAGIGDAESALNAIAGRTIKIPIYGVYRGTEGSPPGSNYQGGPSAYVRSFAAGGDERQRMLDRAAERAVVRQGNRSQKVSKPTMLTGEEAPRHPEYVIATNPAYRDANERYLGAAARDLGYEVVPAYAKGKAPKKKAKKAGAQAAAADKRRQLLSNGPKATKSGGGKKVAASHFPGVGKLFNEKPINAEIGHINVLEENYEHRKTREEAAINAGRLDNWTWEWYRQNQREERAARKKLRDTIIPNQIERVEGHRDKATQFLTKGAGRPGKVKEAARGVNRAKAAYDAIDRDDFADGDKGSKAYKDSKDDAKRSYQKAKRRLDIIKREVKRAKALQKEAKANLSKLRNQQREQNNPIEITEDDEQYITDVETGLVEKPYENFAEKAAAKAKEEEDARLSGADTPSLGEQTATYNALREDLYKQFASNITGVGGTAASGASPSGGVVSSGGFGPALHSVGNPAGATPQALAAIGGGPSAQTAPETKGGGRPDRVTNVTNNFAAPPPDPHTWTRQQEFELGNL